MLRSRLWLFALATFFFVPPAPLAAEEKSIDFNREIRPILSENCYACHGPDANERQAGLRLDRRDAALAELESGAHAIVPGDVEKSTLVARISAADSSERMPPEDSDKKLTAEQIQKLTQWIAAGAPWEELWSFVPPEKAELPAVSDEAKVVNAIDRFTLARLEKEGLGFSPPADKVTLLRRATLDLTGLPPTPGEVDAFLADDSPNAYEMAVDRLLMSSRYGEHMARQWLDLARYGDTHGLHLDNERSLWKYRDWVIKAFNENLPYNQFTIQQLAGDLLPEATLEQRIATGFNRCNVTTSEGGSINEEVLVRYAVDRTSTMSTVFMGLTLGCAVCHDHKFDPVSQKEFYQLYAFFNSAADAAMDGNQIAPPPIIKAPEPEQTEQIKKLDEEIAAIRQKITAELAKIEYAEPPATEAQPAPEPEEYVWIEDAAPPGAQLQGNSAWEFVSQPDHPVHSGQKSTRRQASGLSQHFFTGASPGLKIGEGDKFFSYVYLDPQNPPKTVMLQFNDGSWEHRAFWGEDLIPFGSGAGDNHKPMGGLPKTGEWVRLEVDAAAVGLKPGAVLNGWAFTQHDGLCYWDKAGIVTRTPQDGQSFESLAKWEAYEKALSQSSVPQPIRDAMKIDPAQRSDEQKKQIRDYFLENIYAKTKPIFDPLHQEVAAKEAQRKAVDDSIPVSLVMADLPQPRETHVLIRGQYDKPGEKVTAGVPSSLPPLAEGAPSNRLGLAKWLVDPSHPLTARVAVNRFWQQYFGRGIVKTAEDFGVQGEWPSHPELLDWLAVDFIESGWDVKRLQKMIVMSAAYRQSSSVTPELLKIDPENVLISRGPRFRLDAELVRDSALFVSGLLVEEVGGKSVKPYQPPGIWEAVGFVGSNTREFKRDDGEALYRRSMYTFWKRTAPPPSLMAFDAPSRENCVARRARTNTPLQALVLMNDEQYVEASRRLAQRMLTEGGATPAEQLAYGFRLATARQPGSDEAEVLLQSYEAHLAHYQSKPEEAAKLLTVGEAKRNDTLDSAQHAAMTMLANLILNLDETVTKE
jgi:hypothetical protein